MFEWNFTVFSESRLWESHVFSFKNARTSKQSRVVQFLFHLFLLLEALRGFGRFWEAFGGFGKIWKALQALREFVRPCQDLEGFGKLQEVVGKVRRHGEALGGFGFSIICPSPRLWEALEGSGRL